MTWKRPLRSFTQRWLRRIWVRLPRKFRRTIVRNVEPRFLIGMVMIAVDDAGRLLCIRHVFRPREYPWGLPSGFLRHGETPERGALRELREETGYDARIEQMLEVRVGALDQLELIFRVRLGGREERQGFEASGFGLFSVDSLPQGFLPSNLEILRKFGFPDAKTEA
jgi:ADP-ribose pyrophosphatase YjhB (NUDIX family)